MKIVLQRVQQANVRVDDKIIGSIGPGYVLLLGIAQGDTKEMADKLSDKVKKLRLFPDQNGKNQSKPRRNRGRNFSDFPIHPLCRLPKGKPSQFYFCCRPGRGSNAL